jgi:hypothetical protein
MRDLHLHLREALVLAQATYTDAANRKRTQPPLYTVGDKVYLSMRNFIIARPSKELDLRYAGPYSITEVMPSGLSYRLDLPHTVHANNCFHTSLLLKSPEDPLEGQYTPLPKPIIVNRGIDSTEPEYKVEQIVDLRRVNVPGKVAASA